MKKIVTVLGARPQFVKAAALSREFLGNDRIEEIIVHTGQHYDQNMSEVFFQEMQIPSPAYNLGIQESNHGAMTGKMLTGIEEVLLDHRPDALLVFGDTNSTLAGALAAVKLHIPVVHVEAGLRSFNTHMPEEINRIVTDRISSILFCPTQTAVDNLVKEGSNQTTATIVNSGDIMLDVALFSRPKSEMHSQIVNRLKLTSGNYILGTLHRAENTDNPQRLQRIVDSLNDVHKNFAAVVLPLHPRTRRTFQKYSIKVDFTCIDPIGYFDMVQLIDHSGLIITDSGGLQKEAFFFDKYCLTIREETEWVELVEGGFNKIVGCDPQKIRKGIDAYFNRPMVNKPAYYGNGDTAKIILQTLINQL